MDVEVEGVAEQQAEHGPQALALAVEVVLGDGVQLVMAGVAAELLQQATTNSVTTASLGHHYGVTTASQRRH